MTEWVWWLLLVQAGLGLIDVVVHHELVCRLPFQASAGRELTLHGIRNLCYCVVYVIIACCVAHGGWAWLVLGMLGLELIITFWDWLEEDQSRRLPPTERALHGLLTINFGVLMSCMVPILWGWAAEPTDLSWANNGLWTPLFVIAALGVGLFGVKDLVAARRLARWATKPTLADLKLVRGVSHPGQSLSILVTGATGLIGRRLVPAWVLAGHRITVLSRRPAVAAELATPLRIIRSLDELADDESIDAVVHLAGEPVAGGLWTRTRKDYLMASRTELTRAVGEWVARTKRKPAVWLNASAIGYYGISDAPDRAFSEEASVGSGFAPRLCQQMERTAIDHADGCRLVNMRIGLVLAREGGYLGSLLPAVDLFVGVILGNGRQWQSWIHRDDVIRIMDHCLLDSNIEGPVNLVAPEPVRAEQLMKRLGRKLVRPVVLHLPRFVLRVAAGDLADELLLGSQRVQPAALVQAGFKFSYETFDEALDGLF